MTILYVLPDGDVRTVQAREGVSLMEAALRASIPGIEAKCRGNCACVTCHVSIDPSWRDVAAPPGRMEESMLDFADGAGPGSRLSCQVRVTRSCDGMRVHVPSQQRVMGL